MKTKTYRSIISFLGLFVFSSTLMAANNIEVAQSHSMRRKAVGDFDRTPTFRTVHHFEIFDSNKKQIGHLFISGRFKKKESWDHLHKKDDNGNPIPSEQAGPHNRRIIEIPDGYSISAKGPNNEEVSTLTQPEHPLTPLVKHLMTNQGIQSAGGITKIESKDFRTVFNKWIAEEYKFTANKVSDSE